MKIPVKHNGSDNFTLERETEDVVKTKTDGTNVRVQPGNYGLYQYNTEERITKSNEQPFDVFQDIEEANNNPSIEIPSEALEVARSETRTN